MCFSAAIGTRGLAPGPGVRIGAECLVAPTYEGSKRLKVSPFPASSTLAIWQTRKRFKHLVVAMDKACLASSSFRYLGTREASDHSELTGA